MANQLGLVNPLFADSAALPATFENSKGYFESRSLLQANDRILSFFECSWDFPWLGQPDFATAQSRAFLAGLRADLPIHTRDHFWIDKDPRLCLTSEAYRHVLLRQIPLIAIVRHPIEVAASLQARDGIPPDRGLALWAAYNLGPARPGERSSSAVSVLREFRFSGHLAAAATQQCPVRALGRMAGAGPAGAAFPRSGRAGDRPFLCGRPGPSASCAADPTDPATWGAPGRDSRGGLAGVADAAVTRHSQSHS
jgi:hypothetical protein